MDNKKNAEKMQEIVRKTKNPILAKAMKDKIDKISKPVQK